MGVLNLLDEVNLGALYEGRVFQTPQQLAGQARAAAGVRNVIQFDEEMIEEAPAKNGESRHLFLHCRYVDRPFAEGRGDPTSALRVGGDDVIHR